METKEKNIVESKKDNKPISNAREFWKWFLYTVMGLFLTGTIYGFITNVDNEVQLSNHADKIKALEELCKEKADIKTVEESHDNIMSAIQSMNEKLDNVVKTTTDIQTELKHQNIKIEVISKYSKEANKEIQRLKELGIFGEEKMMKNLIKKDSMILEMNYGNDTAPYRTFNVPLDSIYDHFKHNSDSVIINKPFHKENYYYDDGDYPVWTDEKAEVNLK